MICPSCQLETAVIIDGTCGRCTRPCKKCGQSFSPMGSYYYPHVKTWCESCAGAAIAQLEGRPPNPLLADVTEAPEGIEAERILAEKGRI